MMENKNAYNLNPICEFFQYASYYDYKAKYYYANVTTYAYKMYSFHLEVTMKWQLF